MSKFIHVVGFFGPETLIALPLMELPQRAPLEGEVKSEKDQLAQKEACEDFPQGAQQVPAARATATRW